MEYIFNVTHFFELREHLHCTNRFYECHEHILEMCKHFFLKSRTHCECHQILFKSTPTFFTLYKHLKK